MGNTCSSSKRSYDTSTPNPWFIGKEEPPHTSPPALQSRIAAVHAGSILGCTSANSIGCNDGSCLNAVLTCGEDKRIALFNWDQPADRLYFDGHTRPVNQVSFVPYLAITKTLINMCIDSVTFSIFQYAQHTD